MGKGDGEWTVAGWKLIEPLTAHCSIALSDTELLSIGGYSTGNHHCDETVKYNVVTGEATQLAPLPNWADSHACVKQDNYIYVSGGSTGLPDINQVWRYDIELDSWDEIASLNNGRFGHS